MLRLIYVFLRLSGCSQHNFLGSSILDFHLSCYRLVVFRSAIESGHVMDGFFRIHSCSNYMCETIWFYVVIKKISFFRICSWASYMVM